jgi:hypothetical protein
VNGTVTGEIYGLVAATDVILNTYPSGLGLPAAHRRIQRCADVQETALRRFRQDASSPEKALQTSGRPSTAAIPQ